jgi:7,8-dihydroneopterin aldolase/epimerase/oxygenase
VEDLACYGYHGVKPEEKALGQRFLVDLTLRLDLGPAGRSDDLGLSVSYSEAARLARERVEGPSRDTIEAVAEEVAAALLERFPRLEGVTVRVKKPAAPIAGVQFGLVAVEVSRERSGPATTTSSARS